MTYPDHRDVAAFILAGGSSSRMGRAKGLLKIDGQALLLRTARVVSPLVSSVTVIGPANPYRRLGLSTIPDRIPGLPRLAAFQGPLAGIVTALSASKSRWNLILACDLPYLSRDWVQALLRRARRTNAQAFLPSTLGGLEPLAAVYRLDAYEKLAEAFQEGVRKVTDALKRIPVETVMSSELGDFEDAQRVLQNMNTPADLAAAEAWWNAENLQNKTRIKTSRKKPRGRGALRRSR
jgi:molybdenum cofactor guanylyltransferase